MYIAASFALRFKENHPELSNREVISKAITDSFDLEMVLAAMEELERSPWNP